VQEPNEYLCGHTFGHGSKHLRQIRAARPLKGHCFPPAPPHKQTQQAKAHSVERRSRAVGGREKLIADYLRGLKNAVALVGGAGEMLFQGAMASIIILIPDIALSISPCTRSTSDVRIFCSSWSSDVSPSSPSIELEVNRAMEDLIRSTSFSI